MYQKCVHTKIENNNVCSYGVTLLASPNCNESKSVILVISACWNMYKKPSVRAKKNKPTPQISKLIALLRINALRLRGLLFMTSGDGGRDANAIAPKVSIIRFTQSIWVTVNGDSVPINAPNKTMKQAATLTVSWNSKNR